MPNPNTGKCVSRPNTSGFGSTPCSRCDRKKAAPVARWKVITHQRQLDGRARTLSPRVLIRPQPGLYVLRLRSGAPLVPAVIYQLCPMVIPQPMTVSGPHPDDWCRPLDRSPRYEARINDKRVDLDRVWTARSLRAVSLDEFQFRLGPLRRWARQTDAPEARPEMPVDLSRLPPLF
jgi:hypothetical protein